MRCVPLLLLALAFAGCSKYAGDTRENVAESRARIDIAELGNFSFDNSNGTLADVPQSTRKLEGQTVEVAGEVYLPDTNGKFLLARRNLEAPLSQRIIICQFPDHRAHGLDEKTWVKVVGKFHIRIEKDETDRIKPIFRIEVQKATTAALP